MANYSDSIRRPPKTLTEWERNSLLRTTGEHVAGFRDHVIYSLAISTGLREHELIALDVGDLRRPDGRIRRRVKLRVFKRSCRDPNVQEVLLNDTARLKVERLLQLRERVEGTLPDEAPLFVSSRRQRLSARRVRSAFAMWQRRAGFERHVNFHVLRHDAINGAYRRRRDIRLAQRFARHGSVSSTQIYTHPSDEDLLSLVQELPA